MTFGSHASYSLREISERFGGEVLGDPLTRVSCVGTLDGAQAHSIAFIVSDRYLEQLKATRAGAVVLGAALQDATSLPRIVCGNPYLYFARVSALLNPPRAPSPGKHPGTIVDPSATVAEGVEIGALCVVGRNVRIGRGSIIGPGCVLGDNVVLGDSARLFANVTVYDGCRTGDRVIVHSGVVIGADGFGIAWSGEGWVKIPQIGGVLIGDDVEIGANTTIDRGTIEDTVIEDGVKLDNQIQIAHNVRIGAHTAIAACAGIAGSARVGRHCRIGGAAGIAGHITIADHVEISAHTLVTKSIDRPGSYSGAWPFGTNAEWRRSAVNLRRMEQLVERVRALERMLAAKERSGS